MMVFFSVMLTYISINSVARNFCPKMRKNWNWGHVPSN